MIDNFGFVFIIGPCNAFEVGWIIAIQPFFYELDFIANIINHIFVAKNGLIDVVFMLH